MLACGCKEYKSKRTKNKCERDTINHHSTNFLLKDLLEIDCWVFDSIIYIFNLPSRITCPIIVTTVNIIPTITRIFMAILASWWQPLLSNYYTLISFPNISFILISFSLVKVYIIHAAQFYLKTFTCIPIFFYNTNKISLAKRPTGFPIWY